jgi:hypothetical protein
VLYRYIQYLKSQQRSLIACRLLLQLPSVAIAAAAVADNSSLYGCQQLLSLHHFWRQIELLWQAVLQQQTHQEHQLTAAASI